MKSVFRLFVACIFLSIPLTLLAQSTLSIIFLNQTEKDVRYIPIISGKVDYIWDKLATTDRERNVIAQSRAPARAQRIEITNLTEPGIVYLMESGEQIANFTITPAEDKSHVVVCSRYSSKKYTLTVSLTSKCVNWNGGTDHILVELRPK